MSKGVKRVLGAVVAIAIPFVAPTIAGALGVTGALGQGLVGAGLGATNAALTGGDPLLGGLTGGLGTYAAGGGFEGLFGQRPLVAGQRSVGGGLFGGQGMTTGTPLYEQGVTGAELLPPGAGGAGGTTGAAGTITNNWMQNLQTGLQGLTDPNTLARITMLALSGGSGVSDEEQKLVELRRQELEQIARTNQELFDQQVAAAQNFMQMAEQNAPNPEQAFAETKIATERQLAEQTRGLGADEASRAQRRSAIRSAQTGATAAAAEETRGRSAQTQLMQAGMAALPSAAPEKYAGLMLPMYQDLAERARQSRADFTYGLTRAMPDLFGRIA